MEAFRTASTSRPVLAAVLVVLGSLVFSTTMNLLHKKWRPEGKHVFITGGSQGLGLALAQLLASKGANVTICSRTEAKLKEAVALVKVSYPRSPFLYSWREKAKQSCANPRNYGGLA